MRRKLLVLAALLVLVAPGCHHRKQKKDQTVEHLPAEALYDRATRELEARSLRKARADLEKIVFTVENRPKLEPLVKLALADVTFYQGDSISLIEARSKYLDFVTLYGDHPRAAYAQFQAGVCSLKQVRDPARDQGQTQRAIEDLREVGRRYPRAPYADPAQDMIDEAERNLAEHEFVVGLFYYKRKTYPAAVERFREVVDKYPRFRNREKLYYYMGQALIRGNNGAEGRIYLDKLLADYPNGEFADEAKKALAARPEAADGANGKS